MQSKSTYRAEKKWVAFHTTNLHAYKEPTALGTIFYNLRSWEIIQRQGKVQITYKC